MKKRLLIDIVVMCVIFAGFFVLFNFQSMEKTALDFVKISDKNSMSDKTMEEIPDLEKSYCYSVLSEEEKKIYQEVYQILKNMQSESYVSTVDEKLLEKVFHCVMNDHPEFYYVDGFSYTSYSQKGKVTKLGFEGNYSKTLEERQSIDKLIELYVENCFAGISDDFTTYDVVKYLYDYLICNTEYLLDAKDSQNICSVFLEGESVCMGYAKAMQYLLLRQEILCTLVNGKAGDGQEHAWNLVFLDGEPYHLDATWGEDSYISSEGIVLANEKVHYNYFCVTTEEISKSHLIENEVELPYCTAKENNYYVKEGLYFDTLDIEKLDAIFQRAYETPTGYAGLKCKSLSVYQEILTYLIDEQHIFKYPDKEKDTITYYGDEELLLLEFWLK